MFESGIVRIGTNSITAQAPKLASEPQMAALQGLVASVVWERTSGSNPDRAREFNSLLYANIKPYPVAKVPGIERKVACIVVQPKKEINP